MNNKVINKFYPFLILIALAVIGRVIPHPPNATPYIALSLLSGRVLGRYTAYFAVFLSYVISNLILCYFQGFSCWGYWFLFTFTGLMIIVFIAQHLKPQCSFYKRIPSLLAITLFYWVWTNAGVWLMDGMYPHTIRGIGECYIMALPFLFNALIGDLFWGFILLSNTNLFDRLVSSYNKKLKYV